MIYDMQNTFYKILKTCFVIFLISCSGEEPSGTAILTDKTVAYASFSNDGNLVATTDYQGNNVLWDIETSKLLYKLETEQKSQHDDFADLYGQITISRDKKLVFISCGQRLEIWDTKTGKIVSNYATNGVIKSFDMNSSGDQVLLGYNDHSVQLINTKTGSLIWKIKYNTSVEKVALSTDGLYALVALDTGFTDLWQVNRNEIINTFKNNNRPNIIAISPENQYVLISTPLEPVRLYDLHSGELMHELVENSWLSPKLFKRNAIQINSATFSNNVKTLVANSNPGRILVWELQTGSLIKELELPSSFLDDQPISILLAASYNSDNSFIYGLTNNGTIYKWHYKK